MKNALVLVLMFFSLSSMACPSAPFNAKNAEGETLAQIRGESILSPGWSAYSTKEMSKYSITRFKHANSGNYTLWLYKMKNPADQPGLLWIVWYDAGVGEGPINRYAIATNLRSAPGQQSHDELTNDSNVRFDKEKDWWIVGCQ